MTGFEARNLSGNLQASSEAANYFLHSSGSMAFSSGATLITNNGSPYYRKAINCPDNNTILAIKPSSGYGGVERMLTSGGITYFNMIATSTGMIIPWKLYTKTPSHTDNFGIEISDSSGNVTFTSSKIAMQLKSLHLFPEQWSEGDSESITGIQDDYIWISGAGVEGHIGSFGFPNTYQTDYPMVKLETNLLRVGSSYLSRTYGEGFAGGGALTVARIG